MTDEILAEVHTIKNALSKRFERGVHAIFVDIKKGEDELRAQGFRFVLPPVHPAAMAGTAFQRNRFANRRV